MNQLLNEELFDIEKVLEKLEDPGFETFKFHVENEGPRAVFFFLILLKVSRQFFANISWLVRCI